MCEDNTIRLKIDSTTFYEANKITLEILLLILHVIRKKKLVIKVSTTSQISIITCL